MNKTELVKKAKNILAKAERDFNPNYCKKNVRLTCKTRHTY